MCQTAVTADRLRLGDRPGVVVPEGRHEQGAEHDHGAGEAASDPGGLQADDRCRGPGPQVTQPGAARHDHDEHALQPAAQFVRRVRLQDRLPVHGRHQVRRAADGEQHDRQPERVRQPRRGDRQPPHDDGDHECDALPVDPADPARRQTGDRRPDGDRREQPPDGRLAAEPLVGSLGEQGTRHGQHHRDDVDAERQQQHRAAGDEDEPLDHRAQPRHARPLLLRRPQRRQRRQPHRRVERHAEEHGVDGVGGGERPPGEDEARHQGSDRGRQRGRREAQRVRGRDVLRRQDARDHRATRRRGDREARRLDRHEREQQPEAAQPEQRLEEQAERATPEHERRHDEQHAAVDDVRDRPAPEPEHDERHQADRAQQTHPERGSADGVDLHGDGDRGHLEPHERDRVARPEPAEVGVAQRGEVDRGAADHVQRASPARGRHGLDGVARLRSRRRRWERFGHPMTIAVRQSRSLRRPPPSACPRVGPAGRCGPPAPRAGPGSPR